MSIAMIKYFRKKKKKLFLYFLSNDTNQHRSNPSLHNTGRNLELHPRKEAARGG